MDFSGFRNWAGKALQLKMAKLMEEEPQKSIVLCWYFHENSNFFEILK